MSHSDRVFQVYSEPGITVYLQIKYIKNLACCAVYLLPGTKRPIIYTKGYNQIYVALCTQYMPIILALQKLFVVSFYLLFF